MSLLNKTTIWDKIELLVTTSSGITMFVTLKDWVQKNIFLYGYYEKKETDFWNNLTENKKIVFDVGANVGYYGLIASKKIISNGMVYGFEPVSFINERAKHNILTNNLKNFILYKIALSDKIGELKINIGNNANWGMSGINTHNYLSGKTETVKTDTVDNFIIQNNIPRLDIIKVDVEGSESNVLMGMVNTLTNYKPIVMIEILDVLLLKAGSSKEAIYNFMWKNNYEAFKILNGTNVKPVLTPESFDGLTLFKHKETPFDNFVKVVA